MTRRFLLLLSLGCLLAAACAPQVGDSCTDALDCAVDGTRLCDTTQPSGYCLVSGCRADECPDEAVCVRFGYDERARTFCMRHCASEGDCRSAYDCVEPTPPPEDGSAEPGVAYTEIIDGSPGGERFCAESLAGL